MVASTAHKLEGRALAVIDCPTPRLAVVSRSLDRLKTLWTRSGNLRKFSILVFCHARFELVAKAQEKAQDLWPEWRNMAVQASRTKFQSVRIKPYYVVVIAHPLDTAMETPPALMLTKSGRIVHRHENLLLRCTEKSCRLRPNGSILNEKDHNRC